MQGFLIFLTERHSTPWTYSAMSSTALQWIFETQMAVHPRARSRLIDRGDSHVDDQLRLMDHLGFEKFVVIGFCIGGPFIWKLLERAPERVLAAVPATPSGFRPEQPNLFFNNNMKNWAPTLCQEQPDITVDMCRAFLDKMYGDPDFVFSVSRESVRRCTTPILVMPDDTDAHPYATAEETALLAPNAQMTFFPWKEPQDRVDMAIRHLRTFLRVHVPS